MSGCHARLGILAGWGLALLLTVGCQPLGTGRTANPDVQAPPSEAPTEYPPARPTQERSPLSEDEASALLRANLAQRGIDAEAARIGLSGAPRWLNIRYSSEHVAESRHFQLQLVLVAMDAAQVAIRVRPPVEGGVKVAAVPAGDSEVGLRVMQLTGHDLRRWANGELSDQEFVYEWLVGTVPRE